MINPRPYLTQAVPKPPVQLVEERCWLVTPPKKLDPVGLNQYNTTSKTKQGELK